MNVLSVALAAAISIAALQPTPVDKSNIVPLFQRFGYGGDYSYEARRDSRGSRLYLYQWWGASLPNGGQLRGSGNGVLVIGGGRVIRRLERPARLAYLNDQEQFVAWTDDLKKGVTLRNGTHIDVAPLEGRFGVDWSGQYFFNANVRTHVTQIASIAEPRKILATSDLHPYAIFAGENRIYLCGWNGSSSVSICEIYALGPQGASLILRKSLQNAHEIRDIDVGSGRMLVVSASDILPVLRIVSLQGGQDMRVGVERAPFLFLEPGVLPLQLGTEALRSAEGAAGKPPDATAHALWSFPASRRAPHNLGGGRRYPPDELN